MFWFPDDRHVLYVVVDRSEQFAPPSTLGVKWELWVVDIVDKQPYQISTGSQGFHEPVISPQGNTIAVAAGSGYCDAGMCDYDLAFIKLSQYKPDGVIRAQDFGGIGFFLIDQRGGEPKQMAADPHFHEFTAISGGGEFPDIHPAG